MLSNNPNGNLEDEIIKSLVWLGEKMDQYMPGQSKILIDSYNREVKKNEKLRIMEEGWRWN